MKALIVDILEAFCTHVWDRIFVSTALGAWLFHDVLHIPVCWAALWSWRLDERWGTQRWNEVGVETTP